MSLVHRSGSIEHIEPGWRSRSVSPAGSQRRTLSFNPVDGGAWSQPAHEELVPAFEVGGTKRACKCWGSEERHWPSYGQPGAIRTSITRAVTECGGKRVRAGGAASNDERALWRRLSCVVFGYAALKPVLIEEGVYRDRCSQAELEDGVHVCYEQELRLNFMFTIAAVSTNVCALPVGAVLDRFGPRVCGMIGVFFLTIGALFFALAADASFDGYIPGYLFLALGGPFVFISSFQLSNTFPKYSGLILALLTGAFDTSSALFLVYRLIYQASNGSFSPKKFFLVYLVVPVYILIVQLTLMPRKSYETVGELITRSGDAATDYHDSDEDISDPETVENLRVARRRRRESVASEVTALLGNKDAVATQTETEEKQKEVSGVWGALHGRSAAQQIRTPWFILITLFTVIQMTRINYFVATISSQYEYMLGDWNAAVRVNSFFDIALPLGGVLSVPFIGLVLDNTSTPFVLCLLVVLATTIGVLGVIPQLWAAYANICLFVLYRPFYYTCVSDYAAKVFGFATFGKVYGLIICLAGVLNFAQSGLDALTHRAFDGNPVPINILLTALAAAVGSVLALFVWCRSGKLDRERIEDAANDAREWLIPGADGGRLRGAPDGRGFANAGTGAEVRQADLVGRIDYGAMAAMDSVAVSPTSATPPP
ncbi:major facilitator superfamily domain-containing protein [Phyllosticta capitalensis]|uniref:Major facilitator superfamily domain-containing protein n=1 Tax=Phyllosticta capitalensis TaxID=121624 RepID=A0ABR1YXD2_9PEZI